MKPSSKKKGSAASPGPGQSAMSSLPISVLKRIAVHVRFDLGPNEADPATAQASLAALTMTCQHVSTSVLPVLYRAPVLNRLRALTLLESTLNDHPDLAARVKRLVAGPTFVDTTTFDCISLIRSVKWETDCGIPSPARFAQMGKTAPRALLMAWLTHFATMCPKLRAVDLSLAADLHSSQALGFSNLAAILYERCGSFRAPSNEDWPVSCILATDPDHAHHGVVYFVRSIDYGNRTLDIFNTNWPGKLAEYNLHPIQDLIPGGALRFWRIRHIDLVHQYEVDPFASFLDNLPAPPLEALGLCLDSSYTFDLNKQLLPGSQSTVSLWTVHLTAAYDILSRRNFKPTQCTTLQFRFPAPTAIESAHPAMYALLMSDLFAQSHSGLERAGSWPAVESLTLAAPFFTKATSLDSLHALTKLAQRFPNVKSLTVESSYTSIADILLSLDPFLRRPDCPLQELTIVRDSLHALELELEGPPPQPQARTKLAADQATKGHLRTLILHDVDPSEDITIHPGLLYGLERLNLVGVDLFVLPAHLAHATAPSFPFINMLAPDAPTVSLLESHKLPHLRSLAFNADRALESAQEDPDIDNLDQLLPEAPRLESLLLEIRDQEYFTRAGFVLDIIDKYAATLRNLYITHTHLSDAHLEKLGSMLAAHQTRVCRVLVGNSANPLVDLQLWAMGDRATTWVSDVLVPERAAQFKLQPASTLARLASFVEGERNVQTKGMRPGKKCVCGKRAMGHKEAELGSQVWCSLRRMVVVCEACVDGVEGKVRVWESEAGGGGGERSWTTREVVHMNAAVGVQGKVGNGIWGLGSGRMLDGLNVD